jgi:hypothetical protein
LSSVISRIKQKNPSKENEGFLSFSEICRCQGFKYLNNRFSFKPYFFMATSAENQHPQIKTLLPFFIIALLGIKA